MKIYSPLLLDLVYNASGVARIREPHRVSLFISTWQAWLAGVLRSEYLVIGHQVHLSKRCRIRPLSLTYLSCVDVDDAVARRAITWVWMNEREGTLKTILIRLGWWKVKGGARWLQKRVTTWLRTLRRRG